MAFVGNVKGLWPFDRSLDDSVLNQDFLPEIATTIPSYTSFDRWNSASGEKETLYGLDFVDDKAYTVPITDPPKIWDSTDTWYISFWYYSPGPLGFTRHAITRGLEPKKAAVVAHADTTTANGLQTISSGNWSIQEVAEDDVHNRMEVLFINSSGIASHANSKLRSLPYAAGLHHFLISWQWDSDGGGDNKTADFRFYLDGKSVGTWDGVALQANNDTTSALRLNSVVLEDGLDASHVSHRGTQEGAYISTLMMIKTYASSIAPALRIMRYGHEYVTIKGVAVDTEQWLVHFGIPFNQPSTITTNKIYSLAGNIYAVRTDGEILRGERPIWDNVHQYGSDKKVSDLTIITPGDDSSAVRTDEGMRLTGSIVKV